MKYFIAFFLATCLLISETHANEGQGQAEGTVAVAQREEATQNYDEDAFIDKLADKILEKLQEKEAAKTSEAQEKEANPPVEEESTEEINLEQSEENPSSQEQASSKEALEEESTPQKREEHPKASDMLEQIEGTWYNIYAKPAIFITEGNLNGFPIVRTRLQGNNRDLILTIEKEDHSLHDHLFNLKVLDGEHTLIILDKVMALRKTRWQNYQESVCGIHLGMAAKDVLSLYGKPEKVTRHGEYIMWHYKRGFRLRLLVEVVTDIYLDRFGEVLFDNTSLSAQNTLQEFYESYHLEKEPVFGMPTGAMHIGGDEYLYFDYYPGEVRLSIFQE